MTNNKPLLVQDGKVKFEEPTCNFELMIWGACIHFNMTHSAPIFRWLELSIKTEKSWFNMR